jgi:DNA-binding NtrC family response regulator
MKNILLVDDDKSVLTFLQLALKRDDFNVDSCLDPVDALNRLQEKPYHLLISDYVMNDVNGVHLLDFARQIQPACVRILLTGNSSMDMLKNAINNAHIFKFIEKPLDPDQLILDVEQSLEHQKILERAYHD